ncbi:hypothetical protein GGR50DRAFT_592046 [Xylaria sp. CBS 124048]|nr:hypothetical protein GGR50DRAFT_592046 [Xylaria sp. CBS 124048]
MVLVRLRVPPSLALDLEEPPFKEHGIRLALVSWRGSRSNPPREYAKFVLAESLEIMYRTLQWLVFWIAARFHTAVTASSYASQNSQLFVIFLDQYSGSAGSSRATANIIALIRRECEDLVGFLVSILGLCGLSYPRHQCQRMIQDEARRLGHEVTI